MPKLSWFVVGRRPVFGQPILLYFTVFYAENKTVGPPKMACLRLYLNAAFHREAGHRAWRKASVPEAYTNTKAKPIRAGVLIRRGPIDPAECSEIKLRHTWHASADLRVADASCWDAFLGAEEQAFKTKYSPARVKPWVFSTLGRPGE